MWMAHRFQLVVLIALAGAAGTGAGASFELTSSAFTAGGAIPSRHTCDGEDVSPPLTWGDPPPHAELALVGDERRARSRRHADALECMGVDRPQ